MFKKETIADLIFLNAHLWIRFFQQICLN